MPPKEKKQVVVFSRQESIASPNRSVNRLTNIAPRLNNSRRLENKEEELAPDTKHHWAKKSPTHNNSKIESRDEIHQTFQSQKGEEDPLDETKAEKLGTPQKQGKFSHSTENSSEESEDEEQTTKK